MALTVATWIINIFLVYAAIGLIFAIAFAFRGAGRIDPVAQQGTLGFRLLIIPGAAALWPLLLRRWLAGVTQPPIERNPHRDASRGLSRPAGRSGGR